MVEWIKELADGFHDIHQGKSRRICRREIIDWIESLVECLYPSRCEKLIGDRGDWLFRFESLDRTLRSILKQLSPKTCQDIPSISKDFFQSLPKIKEQLDEDAAFFLDQDPAANSREEVIICYPGFLALAIHRVAHRLLMSKTPLLPRIVSEYAHEKTGIDIHPGAQLACPIFIDHGTGIVIGESTIIGSYVKIFQGVTLGAPSVSRRLRGVKRHPTIHDHVILYANATILGGETEIGARAVIGGNAWITSSVPSDAKVFHHDGL